MTLSLASSATVDLMVGQVWRISVKASSLPVLVVTKPDDTILTPALLFELNTDDWVAGCGPWSAVSRYDAVVPIPTAGRYRALITDGVDSVIAVAFAFVIAEWPTFVDLDDWLGGPSRHSWSDEELTSALEVEARAQRRVCNVPANYHPDLREALLRRAARSLDLRRKMTDAGGDSNDFEVPAGIPISRDQEIRRLEAPWRRLVTG